MDERPREKLIHHGKQSLSNTELLGILIATGVKNKSAIDVARDLLALAENDLNQLARFTVNDFCKVEGIGPAKAITIISAIEFGGRRESQTVQKRKKITSSTDAYRYIGHKLADQSHEEFWVVYLSRSNQIIGESCVSKGGFSQTVVDPKVIYKSALERKASALILCHNHPSGNLKPSQADLSLTDKIKAAGKLLDIQVLDHLIVTSESYLSFADDGLM